MNNDIHQKAARLIKASNQSEAANASLKILEDDTSTLTPTGKRKKAFKDIIAKASESARHWNEELASAKGDFLHEYASLVAGDMFLGNKEKLICTVISKIAQARYEIVSKRYAEELDKFIKANFSEGQQSEGFAEEIKRINDGKCVVIDITEASAYIAGINAYDRVKEMPLRAILKINFDEWGFVVHAHVEVTRGERETFERRGYKGITHDFRLETSLQFCAEGMNFATYGTETTDTIAFEAASRIVCSKFADTLGLSYWEARTFHERNRNNAIANAYRFATDVDMG